MSESETGADQEAYPMYCPECDEMVSEWWDKYDETFACPECRSMTYETKEEFIDVTHGVARFRRENGYEGDSDV